MNAFVVGWRYIIFIETWLSGKRPKLRSNADKQS
jgi:hypothetical protein